MDCHTNKSGAMRPKTDTVGFHSQSINHDNNFSAQFIQESKRELHRSVDYGQPPNYDIWSTIAESKNPESLNYVSPRSSKTEEIDENLERKSSQQEENRNERIKEKLNDRGMDASEKKPFCKVEKRGDEPFEDSNLREDKTKADKMSKSVSLLTPKQINHKKSSSARNKLAGDMLNAGKEMFRKCLSDMQETTQEIPKRKLLDDECEQTIRDFSVVTDQYKLTIRRMTENGHHLNTDIEILRSEIEERMTRIETFKSVINWLKMKQDYNNKTVMKEIVRFHDHLPIYNIRLKLKKSFENTSRDPPVRVVIVTAETGSGKSTQIPLYLALDGIIADDMHVLCIAPRKLVACSLAYRLSKELQDTEYFASAKIDGRFLASNNAKIVFATPRCLLKELSMNKMLNEYGCVMIDEAHERTIDGDLCLSMIKLILKNREDFKLVIASASMDEDLFKKYFDEFGVATLSINNRQYPVEIKNSLSNKNMGHVERCLHKVVDLCNDMLVRVQNNDWEAVGDILVFLTSPSEVRDAELRLRLILSSIRYPANVEILSLHGKMSQDEQSRACVPCHQYCLHRVLFATNVAEASLTLPDVRYVIDCGLVKRERYDAIRETSIIQLGSISKSEAQQRAGRAGRTAPGICYRLYSEEDYEKMEKIPLPEIARKDLDSVVLYLLSVGVKKPETFDFIEESIGKEHFQQSLTTLKSLRAIEFSGGLSSLTNLGRQMIDFPIPPTLSYMVLESRKYDIVPEMAVICVCINIRSIFFNYRDQEGTYRADSVRLRMSDERGDPLTYLRVFSEYIKQRKESRRRWCRVNDVSEKAMKQVLQMVNQIVQHALRDSERYHQFSCERYEFEINRAAHHIRRLFCEVFKRNIAVYSGAPQGGYINIATKERVWIHPASSLRSLCRTPEYIVYEYAYYTSRLFANDVMQADADWVRSVINDDVLKRIEEQKLVAYNVRMGPSAKTQLRKMIKQMKKEVDQECHINADLFGDRYGRLQIYVQSRHLDTLQKFIERHIHPEVNLLKEETCEFPVTDTDYKIHFGPGAIVKEIILPGEYCSIFAGKGYEYFDWQINAKFLHDELYPHFEKYGKITKVICFRELLHERTGCACMIRFDNKQIARRVVEAHVDDSNWGVSIKPESDESVNVSQAYDFQRFSIDIRWRRRKSRRCGYAKLPNITFDQLRRLGDRLAREHRNFQMETRYGHQSVFNRRTDLSRWNRESADVSEIAFRLLDEKMTSEELYERIEPHCRALNIDLHPDNVFVVYDKSYPPENEEKLRDYKNRISSYLERLGVESKIIPEFIESAPSSSMHNEFDHKNRELPFEVEIDPVRKATDMEITAQVRFLNVSVGRRFMSAVERDVERTGVPLSMGDVVVDSVKMEGCYKIGFEMSRRLLRLLYDDFAELEQQIRRSDLPVSLRRFPPQQNRFVVAVVGGNYERVCEAHQQLKALVEGITLDCRDANERRRAGEESLIEQPYHKLLSDGARMWLKNNISEAVIVSFVRLRKQIRLQGSRKLIEKTKQDIDEFLRNRLSRLIEVKINLKPPYYRYGMTMAFLKAFGNENLQRLAVEIGPGVQLRLQIPMQQLYFYGLEAEYDKLLECLRDFSDRLPYADDLGDGEPLTCTICLCTPNSESFYCFEACGHYACIECLNNQINSAISNLDFPICCTGCGQPYVISDFKQLMMDRRSGNKIENLMDIKGLIDSSLTFYMNHNNDKYRPCITPNCRGIHQVTIEPKLHACSLCGRELCSHCGNENHGKLSCEEYQTLRGSADASIVEWIAEDPAHRRRCPNNNCGAVIEKQAGCNHMQCEKCKIHFCWLCPYSNEESEAIYAHLQAEHGGHGADLDALLQDIDDPVQAQMILAELRNQNGMVADLRREFILNDEIVDEWWEDEAWMLEEGEDLDFDIVDDNIGDGVDEVDMWSEDYEGIEQDLVDMPDEADLPDEVDHADAIHFEGGVNLDDNEESIWDDGQTEYE